MLLPISAVFALVLAAQGVIAELAALSGHHHGRRGNANPGHGARRLARSRSRSWAPTAAASSTPTAPIRSRIPTPLTNFLELLSIFAIPAGLTYTLGRMAGNQRQGWAMFGAMAMLVRPRRGAWPIGPNRSRIRPWPICRSIKPSATWKARRSASACPHSALFATVTTDASCGAVNSMHDSFTPLGGLVPLVNIQLGEMIFGGVGAGLYGMLVFVVLTVFIAGLMVGRTPEYLGKKIEVREMKLAMLYVLIFPLIILTLSAWSAIYEKQAAEFAAALPPPDATRPDTPPSPTCPTTGMAARRSTTPVRTA